MNNVHAYKKRNSETRVLDGNILQSLNFFNAFDVENASHVALCNVATYLSVECATSSDVASYHKVKLSNLLL